MRRQKVHFVYRKPNPGNYSIEHVFDQLTAYWESSKDTIILPKKIRLKRTYDLLTFLACFLRSLLVIYRVVHITGGCNYMVMAFPFTKRILTVHDLFYLDKGKIRYRKLYTYLFYTLPVRYASIITVVSEQTKNELLCYFPRAAKKVVVIANPLDASLEQLSKDVQKAARPKGPINILQLGSKSLKNYKNLILAAKDLDVNFTFVHGETAAVNALLAQHQLSDRAKVLSGLSFSELTAVYLAADVLFFASYAEGFGLPLIEAQAINLPVITSDLEPMRSLAPFSILVAPDDIEQIREAIASIISTGVNAESLKAASQFTGQFKVAKIATQYQKLYLPAG